MGFARRPLLSPLSPSLSSLPLSPSPLPLSPSYPLPLFPSHAHNPTPPPKKEYVRYKKQHEKEADLRKRVAIHATQKKRARRKMALERGEAVRDAWGRAASFSGSGRASAVGGDVVVAAAGVGAGAALPRLLSSSSLRAMQGTGQVARQGTGPAPGPGPGQWQGPRNLRSVAFASSHDRLADPAFFAWMRGHSNRFDPACLPLPLPLPLSLSLSLPLSLYLASLSLSRSLP